MILSDADWMAALGEARGERDRLHFGILELIDAMDDAAEHWRKLEQPALYYLCRNISQDLSKIIAKSKEKFND